MSAVISISTRRTGVTWVCRVWGVGPGGDLSEPARDCDAICARAPAGARGADTRRRAARGHPAGAHE